MVKVLMVVKAIEKSGVTNVMRTYIEHIDREKYEIDIVTGQIVDIDSKTIFESCGCNVKLLSNRDKNIIIYIKKLCRIIKKGKYDIVHVHGNSALIFPELLAAKMAKCKIRIAHSHNTKCNHPMVNRLVQPIFNCLYTHAIACSTEAGTWMFKGREFDVVNNAIDVKQFVFDEEIRDVQRKKLGVETKFVVGHVGFFNDQKNHEFLIDVFKEIVKVNEDAVLLLIGVGELMSTIKEKVYKLGLLDKVIFYGSSNEVNSLMMAMDVFVFPSQFEGLGIVLVEAQATGLRCFASDKVPQLANVTGTVRFFSLQSDVAMWSKAVLGLTSDLDRNSISKNNVELIKKNGFDTPSVIEKLQKLYNTSR